MNRTFCGNAGQFGADRSRRSRFHDAQQNRDHRERSMGRGPRGLWGGHSWRQPPFQAAGLARKRVRRLKARPTPTERSDHEAIA